jgi:hypothetical protein
MKRMNNRVDFLISRRNAQMNRILNQYGFKIEKELNKGGNTMDKYKSRVMSCSRSKSKGWGGVKLKS